GLLLDEQLCAHGRVVLSIIETALNQPAENKQNTSNTHTRKMTPRHTQSMSLSADFSLSLSLPPSVSSSHLLSCVCVADFLPFRQRGPPRGRGAENTDIESRGVKKRGTRNAKHGGLG